MDAPDPWRLSKSDVVGRVAMRWWGIGWVVKAAPVLLAGALLLALLDWRLVRRGWRLPTTLLGGGHEPRRTIGSVNASEFFVAAATDPVIGRAIARVMNMLILPTELATDVAFVTRAAEVMADPDAYPPPPRTGPSRTELLAALAA